MSNETKKTYPMDLFEVRKWEKNGQSGVLMKPVWSASTYNKGIKNIKIELNDGTVYTIDSNTALFKRETFSDIDYKLNNNLMTEEQHSKAKASLEKNNTLCFYTFKPQA